MARDRPAILLTATVSVHTASPVLAQETDDDDDGDGAPAGGVETGAGGTADGASSALPLAVGGGALMVGFGAAALARRRATTE